MASAIQILDGVTDLSSGIDWRSLDMVSVLTKEKGSLKFDILIPNPASPPTIPALGDTIYLKYNGTVLWGGTCTEKETVVDGGILTRVKVTCMDWGYQFDSLVVHKTYQNLDPHDIVVDIVSNFAAAGFTTNNVQTGNFKIASVKYNYEQGTRCLESLAKLIGWDWYIDPHKDVHFFFANTTTGSSETDPAPFNIDDTSGKILWPTLDVDTSIANLKNSIYVIGGTMFRANSSGSTPEVYTTVSGQLTYSLGTPYDTTTLSGGSATVKVTLDGSAQSIGIDGTTDPGTVNVLYSPGSGGGAQGSGAYIKFTSDPGAGHTLKIFGNASLPIVAHLTSPSSIATYGEFQDTIIDKQIKSIQEAQARADAELIQFDHPVYDVKFDTLVSGLAIGQTITLNSTISGVSNYRLLIRRIEATVYSPTDTSKGLLFHVEALGSDNVTFTDLMMTLLQDSLAENVTADNTILQEILSVEEGLTLTDAVTATGTSRPYKWETGSPQIKWGFWTWD